MLDTKKKITVVSEVIINVVVMMQEGEVKVAAGMVVVKGLVTGGEWNWYSIGGSVRNREGAGNGNGDGDDNSRNSSCSSGGRNGNSGIVGGGKGGNSGDAGGSEGKGGVVVLVVIVPIQVVAVVR